VENAPSEGEDKKGGDGVCWGAEGEGEEGVEGEGEEENEPPLPPPPTPPTEGVMKPEGIVAEGVEEGRLAVGVERGETAVPNSERVGTVEGDAVNEVPQKNVLRVTLAAALYT